MVGRGLWEGDGTPLEVTRDTSTLEAFLEQSSGELDRVLGPLALFRGFSEPFLMEGLDLRQIDEDVRRLTNYWGRGARLTFGVNEFNGIDKFATSIALVSLCVGVVAEVALSMNESIC